MVIELHPATGVDIQNYTRNKLPGKKCTHIRAHTCTNTPAHTHKSVKLGNLNEICELLSMPISWW